MLLLGLHFLHHLLHEGDPLLAPLVRLHHLLLRMLLHTRNALRAPLLHVGHVDGELRGGAGQLGLGVLHGHRGLVRGHHHLLVARVLHGLQRLLARLAHDLLVLVHQRLPLAQRRAHQRDVALAGSLHLCQFVVARLLHLHHLREALVLGLLDDGVGLPVRRSRLLLHLGLLHVHLLQHVLQLHVARVLHGRDRLLARRLVRLHLLLALLHGGLYLLACSIHLLVALLDHGLELLLALLGDAGDGLFLLLLAHLLNRRRVALQLGLEGLLVLFHLTGAALILRVQPLAQLLLKRLLLRLAPLLERLLGLLILGLEGIEVGAEGLAVRLEQLLVLLALRPHRLALLLVRCLLLLILLLEQTAVLLESGHLVLVLLHEVRNLLLVLGDEVPHLLLLLRHEGLAVRFQLLLLRLDLRDHLLRLPLDLRDRRGLLLLELGFETLHLHEGRLLLHQALLLERLLLLCHLLDRGLVVLGQLLHLGLVLLLAGRQSRLELLLQPNTLRLNPFHLRVVGLPFRLHLSHPSFNILRHQIRLLQEACLNFRRSLLEYLFHFGVLLIQLFLKRLHQSVHLAIPSLVLLLHFFLFVLKFNPDIRCHLSSQLGQIFSLLVQLHVHKVHVRSHPLDNFRLLLYEFLCYGFVLLSETHFHVLLPPLVGPVLAIEFDLQAVHFVLKVFDRVLVLHKFLPRIALLQPQLFSQLGNIPGQAVALLLAGLPLLGKLVAQLHGGRLKGLVLFHQLRVRLVSG
mmetsp:Transcript_12648/g.21402  ORF Transcript_12648/g.21402 Transcript_12648/m.21402 type:complete len:742 (-) Transcript_12648:629-2854(-)